MYTDTYNSMVCSTMEVCTRYYGVQKRNHLTESGDAEVGGTDASVDSLKK